MTWFLQSEYNIRFDWGLEGAKNLVNDADVVIVIDVLSFSSCVDVGASAGAEIFPFFYKDSRSEEYAESVNALCASSKRSKDKLCLSPRTLNKLKPGDKLVLPSPNGATISFSLENSIVLCGCLRNAKAVAMAANKLGKNILVIAAGEKWGNDTLRPAIEDLIGAGAIISYLNGSASPEAIAALSVFRNFENDLLSAIIESSSGKELAERGFPEDNEDAAAFNVSATVPILKGKSFHSLNLNTI